MGRLLGCWCVAVQVAAALLPAPSPRACGALRRAAVADVTDGFLSPQQIKTLRKEIDGRRKRKVLPWGKLEAGEGVDEAPFREATVAAAVDGCGETEFFEVSGCDGQDAKRWPDVAFALAAEVDAMVVQLLKRKAVLYVPKPPGTPGAVVLWRGGKAPWTPRPRAIRDGRGAILGREGDFDDDDDDDADAAAG